jgi:hypothetical protein
MSGTTSNSDSVERDLDETRSRLGTHLSQLEDRLSPGQVLDDLMAYFRGSEGAAFGHNLLESMRANPMPAALTGIGLAWLMASNPRPQADTNPSSADKNRSSRVRVYSSGPRDYHYGRDDHDATMSRLQDAERRVTRNADESDTVYKGRLDEARGQALGLARHTQETAESFGQRIRDAVEATQQAVKKGAQSLQDQVSGTVGVASNAASSAGTSAREIMHGAAQYTGGALSRGGQMGGNALAALSDSPVLLGALGLAAGALLGALIPQSEQEQEALGGVANQARSAATNLANEGLERGQRVAHAVADKARKALANTAWAAKEASGK